MNTAIKQLIRTNYIHFANKCARETLEESQQLFFIDRSTRQEIELLDNELIPLNINIYDEIRSLLNDCVLNYLSDKEGK